MKLLLFDIDGTLIHTGGAGKRAMNMAFEKVFRVKDALDGVSLAGRTDTAILIDVMAKYQIAQTDMNYQMYRECYFEFIQIEIKVPDFKSRIMPGIPALLDSLIKNENITLALLTGNWELSGRVKLAHFGLSDYFEFGAFSDDSAIRHELIPFALRRFNEKNGYIPHAKEVFIIGDTFSDVDCAHAHQAIAVAVATGPYSLQQLKDHHAEYVFNDFSDLKKALEILG